MIEACPVIDADPAAVMAVLGDGWSYAGWVVEPDATGTKVTMMKDVSEGPVRLLTEPVRQLGIAPRNRETLRRLAYLVEGRAAGK